MNDIIDIIKNFESAKYSEIDLVLSFYGFLLCIILSNIVRFTYIKRGKHNVYSDNISSIIPILSCIVFLLITVIKSSLALSLGLVGALSIVRFRTPIKEPEDLIILFFSIAIGLGYGAGYLIFTSVFSLIICLIFMYKGNKYESYNLIINWSGNLEYPEIEKTLRSMDFRYKLIRIDYNDDNNTAVLQIQSIISDNVNALRQSLRTENGKIEITYILDNNIGY